LVVRQQSLVHPAPSGTLSPLLMSRAGEVVAAVWTAPDIRLRYYVLPFLPSYVPVLEWLADFGIPEFVPSAARRRRSSLGKEPTFQTREELETRSVIADLETNFVREMEKLGAILERDKAAADAVRHPLLYGSGAELVDAVARVLEGAGVEVENLDETFEDTISADLLASIGSRRMLVEVKSATGNAAENLVEVAAKHLRTWPALRPNDPVDGIVLVLNHQTRIHPDDRQPEPYARREFLQSLTMPVIPTRRLFDWWRVGDEPAIVTSIFGT
jgi:hypothetical protein